MEKEKPKPEIIEFKNMKVWQVIFLFIIWALFHVRPMFIIYYGKEATVHTHIATLNVERALDVIAWQENTLYKKS